MLRTRRAHSIAHLGQGSAPLQSLGSELNKPSEGSPEQAGSELGGEQGGHSNEAPLVNAEGAAQRSLRIVALIVPDAVQNNTQNVTLGKFRRAAQVYGAHSKERRVVIQGEKRNERVKESN